jgi:hypothetical protein
MPAVFEAVVRKANPNAKEVLWVERAAQRESMPMKRARSATMKLEKAP